MTTKNASADTAETEPAGTRETDRRLPLFYKQIVLLNSHLHGSVTVEPAGDYRFTAMANVIPLILGEVATAQAHYPIVFTDGDQSVPAALMGLPEKGNRFVDASGRWESGKYVPAYVRRYPFLLARTDEKGETLSLCFDPTADLIRIGAGKGNLFKGAEPSEIARNALRFCEKYEASARQTEAVIADLIRLKLLIDGEALVRKAERAPVSMRGFRIVSEQILRNLPSDDLAQLAKSGGLALIYAHLFSLRHLEALVDGPADGAGLVEGDGTAAGQVADETEIAPKTETIQ